MIKLAVTFRNITKAPKNKTPVLSRDLSVDTFHCHSVAVPVVTRLSATCEQWKKKAFQNQRGRQEMGRPKQRNTPRPYQNSQEKALIIYPSASTLSTRSSRCPLHHTRFTRQENVDQRGTTTSWRDEKCEQSFGRTTCYNKATWGETGPDLDNINMFLVVGGSSCVNMVAKYMNIRRSKWQDYRKLPESKINLTTICNSTTSTIHV